MTRPIYNYDICFVPLNTLFSKGWDCRGLIVQLITVDNALACLPLVGLSQKLSFPVTVVSGAARVCSFGSEKYIQASISLIALGAAYANPLLGAGILSIQDIF